MHLAALPAIISDYPEASVASMVVLLGLIVYGFKDVLHFSFQRAWAIGGVCFQESIRRRVLWIIPLTIFGLVVVAQLQHPLDEQDAIRQTTKFCLFATGLVVTITAIILACTNLPKEIESRVIYTIVTKPITRLEIVLGKVIGFVRISATILIIMGIFTYGYTQVRALSLKSSIAQRLTDPTLDPAAAATLTHYRDAGLLNSRTYAHPADLEIVAREPVPGDKRRWMFGADGNFIVPFQVSREDLIPKNDPTQTPGSGGVYILAHISYEPADLQAIQPANAKPIKPSLPPMVASPTPTTAPDARIEVLPSVSFDLLDQNENTLLDAHLINGGKTVQLPDADGRGMVEAYVPASQADVLLKSDVIYVRCHGSEGKMEYAAGAMPIILAVPSVPVDPSSPTAPPPPLNSEATLIKPVSDPTAPNQVTSPSFATNIGQYGMQVRGGTGHVPLAIYQFTNVQAVPDQNNNVSLELRVGLERSGDEQKDDPEAVKVTVVNHAKAAQSGAAQSGAAQSGDAQSGDVQSGDQRYTTFISPEINRTTFFTVPASAVAGGNFDVILQCMREGEFLGVQTSSLNLVLGEHSFLINLFKSLFILWLLSLLVVIIAIFCSTFLSWPIAVVLTVLILLGRWAVLELGDATAPGIGNMVATDMGLRDPSKMRVVSDSVEALAKLLNVMARVLPDISKFSALEDIERGVSLPFSRVADSLGVILIFGIPLIVVSYVLLRQKEVAP